MCAWRNGDICGAWRSSRQLRAGGAERKGRDSRTHRGLWQVGASAALCHDLRAVRGGLVLPAHVRSLRVLRWGVAAGGELTRRWAGSRANPTARPLEPGMAAQAASAPTALRTSVQRSARKPLLPAAAGSRTGPNGGRSCRRWPRIQEGRKRWAGLDDVLVTHPTAHRGGKDARPAGALLVHLERPPGHLVMPRLTRMGEMG
jgi:hypothetical protein